MNIVVSVALIQGGFLLLGIVLTWLVNNKKLGKIHKQINGRMDELVEINKVASKAEGKKEEKDEQQVRDQEK